MPNQIIYYLIISLFASLLLWISVIDFKKKLIPNYLTYPGIVLGILISFLYPSFHSASVHILGLKESVLGLLAGFLIAYIFALIGRLIFRKDVIGGGDVKLLAMIGVFIGWKGVLTTFFLAPFIALPFSLFYRLWKKEAELPYGPFLAISGMFCLFFTRPLAQFLFTSS